MIVMEESTSQFDSLGADENEIFGDVAEAECQLVLGVDKVVSPTHDTATDNNTQNDIHSHCHTHSHDTTDNTTHDHVHNREEATTSSSTCFTKPFVGMEFETLQKAFLFYNEYAAIVGFSVRKDKTRKSNIDGSYLFRRFCCSKEGYPRKSLENGGNGVNTNIGIGMQVKDGKLVKMEAARIQPVPRVGRRAKLDMKRRAEIQQRMRVGCNARLDVKRTTDGRWIVQKFVEEHNHECVSLDETHLLRSHRSRRAARALLDRNGVGELPSSEERIINEVPKPSVGMEFESPHKAYLFYNAYARTLGFVVRKDKTRRSNIDGSLLFRRLCCSKEGYRRKNCENDDNDRKQMIGGVIVKVRTRILPVTRVGCNAKLEVKKSTDGKWVVQKFIEEHNHELDRLGDMLLFKTHKLDKPDQEALLDSVTDGSARPKKVSSYIMSEAGGSEKISFIEARLRNRMKKKKRRKLEKGDTQIILNYFRRMQAENPAFFYAIQVDEEDQMSGCFWADARSRSDFGHFGDVVYFETTYGANTCGRPFTPLLGVNNHLQTVLFGCAIILNETEESFAWLLETLLKAMYGRHPVTVITDQDAEMEKAIGQLLPGTNHCLSLWHILQNTAKNLSHLYNKDDIFSTDYKNCIYEPQLCEEFESRWESLLDKFDLRDNEWLGYLYIRRHKWVPVYSKHIFHAHTMSIEQNESMHSFFNGYVLSKALPMTEFISQYEKAIFDSREKETYEDSISRQTHPVLKSELPLEKQAAESYTRLVFQEFHKEFTDSFNYMAVETEMLGTIKTFLVSRWGQNSSWLVKFDSCDNDTKVTCSCQSFESVGILCRHILKVFTATNVMLIPDVYIRKRWTKRAKCGMPSHKNESVVGSECESSLALRYRNLCQLALTLSAKGALSFKAYQTASCAVEMKLREVEKVPEGDIIVSQLDVQGTSASHSPIEAVNNNQISNRLVCADNPTVASGSQIASSDPPRVRPRGRPPKKVMPTLLENHRKKKARTEPESSEHNGVHSHPRSEAIASEPIVPCNFGGKDGQETHNSPRLSNLCPNICVYVPGPAGDLNDQYHSTDTSGFGEPFAGLSCIQSSEHNIFDLNQELTVGPASIPNPQTFQELTVGPASIPNPQTSHFDLNQVNHVVRPPLDSRLLPSSGWFKLNFGGCSKEIYFEDSDRRRIGGYGGAVSLSDGSIIKSYAGSAAEVQAVEAEILGLWNGLKLLSALPSGPVWIEGDSDHVIKWLRRESEIPWRFTPMFFEIEAIMSRLVLGRITHIHQEGNSVAGKLANEGLSKDSLVIWDQMPSL
ncbi:hypothetical protein C5167_037746 [Papaver somniferum]|uniref:SWIM-type domain-containing protein n=1 Tax=Papaver somniferum TaxID=3469 RepID=A0A4Y7IAP9_PAPSO|nr:protein FAR1-RELATED SEQUENCE 7-like [Papaver somniferum]RZC44792.1 hypothetical protein C5167_037746 [Papaver somniferum]